MRQDVAAKGEPIRDASRRRAAADAICKLLTIYEEAELRMIGFVEANSNKCGIPHEISEKIRTSHVATEKLKGQTCSK